MVFFWRGVFWGGYMVKRMDILCIFVIVFILLEGKIFISELFCSVSGIRRRVFCFAETDKIGGYVCLDVVVFIS